MFAFLHAPWLLVGLAGLAIPILIHLLNRRRYDVVDWGAMRFLKVSETTRRRLLLEEVLLMLLRMALIAALVFGLAGPFLDMQLPAALQGRPPRDVVLVIDGSASMGAGEESASPAERAKQWALRFLDELTPGDAVALLLAREQPVPLVGELSPELDRVRKKVRELPVPTGSCNVADSLRLALSIARTSQKGQREVIVLTDNQRFGWADSTTLFRLELLAGEMGRDELRPKVWVVDLAEGRKAAVPNWAVGPLRCNRPVVPVDREVTFQSELVLTGQSAYAPPHRVRLEVDGQAVRDLPPPKATQADGKVPFTFTHRFRSAGSHLVSVILEADPPAGERPAGLVPRDQVPGDNRQDFAVEVVEALPVLLVDGEASAAPPPQLGTDFLRDALSPARDTHPVVKARVVTVNDFAPSLLTTEPAPRVVVLHNVARLQPAQQEALTAYLVAGGGVLVAAGERTEAEWYNDALFRGGDGWLPARLDGIDGDETKPADGVRPEPASFNHPALELFRRAAIGGLGDVRLPRWWKLTTPGQHAAGTPVGLLQGPGTKVPFLVERGWQAGRVLLSAVPFDASWGSNLTDLPAFVPLVHELTYYLAGARAGDYNLPAGQPIRHRIEGELSGYTLQPPGGEPTPLSAVPGEPGTLLAQRVEQGESAVLIYEGARTSGVYRLRTPEKKVIYFVVPADAREADLTPIGEEERRKVAKVAGVEFVAEDGITAAWTSETQRQDLWLYLLLGLIGLLCLEVWMTRRLVKGR